MPAHAGDEANHPHRDGRTSGDEDDGGKDDGATSTGGGEEKNAFAKRGMAGHGEREAWGGGCLGHVVEGEGVGFGVGSAFEQVGVAGILALREKGAAHPPDGGVEPMKDAGDLGEEGHPKAATLDVAEFDRAGDAELGECFGEKGGGLRGDSILSPTVHGEEITEAAKGEEEEKGERGSEHGIYLMSLRISAISASVSCWSLGSSRAATRFSGLPLKKVPRRLLSALRLAFLAAIEGR